MTINRKRIIKRYIMLFFAIMLLIYAGLVIIKYNIEGEKNMPFNLSKVTIVSTAEGNTKEENKDKKSWIIDVIQNNDVYLSIEKNENYTKEEKIQNVRIENIYIEEQPIKGEIKKYMPNSSEGSLFRFSDDYIVENSLEYRGAEKSDFKLLEIANQGGTALFRISNTGLGEYTLDSSKAIVHSGKLLSQVGIKNEDIKFKVKFDVVIELKNKSYITTIELELPYGDIIENGTETQEIINNGNFIFKRV